MKTYWMIEIQGAKFLSAKHKPYALAGVQWSEDSRLYLTFTTKENAQTMLSYFRENDPELFPMEVVSIFVSEHSYLGTEVTQEDKVRELEVELEARKKAWKEVKAWATKTRDGAIGETGTSLYFNEFVEKLTALEATLPKA